MWVPSGEKTRSLITDRGYHLTNGGSPYNHGCTYFLFHSLGLVLLFSFFFFSSPSLSYLVCRESFYEYRSWGTLSRLYKYRLLKYRLLWLYKDSWTTTFPVLYLVAESRCLSFNMIQNEKGGVSYPYVSYGLPRTQTKLMVESTINFYRHTNEVVPTNLLISEINLFYYYQCQSTS